MAPQIVKEFGALNIAGRLLIAASPTVAIATMCCGRRYSDRSGERHGTSSWPAAGACGLGACRRRIGGHPCMDHCAALSLAIAGIMAARPPLWTMPTMFLSGSAAAAGIATINSIGNLGGFVGPTLIGWIKDLTGSFLWGLYFVAALLASRLSLVHARFAAAATASPQASEPSKSGRELGEDGSGLPNNQPLHQRKEEIHMRNYRIAAMGGDGIGPEVVAAGVQALKVCAERDGGFTLDFQDFDWGSDYYKKHGVMMPADGADQLRKFDAILFGAVGAPDIPDHITLWGLRLAICQPLDQYANVRPTRILPGITSPLRHVSGPELDWVIVRENSEGEYSGVGGRVHKGLPEEVATDVSMMTRAGVARIIRFAFKLAQSRPRKLLTVVTKSNAQRHAMVMWDEIAAEVAQGIPGRDLGQDAGRCHDHAHDHEAADAGHDRRHQPARRHPVRSGGGAGRLARHRADREPQSRARTRPRCSSRSTARPSTSPARASPIRSPRSGPRP